MTVDAIVKARYIEYFHLVIEIVDTVVMVSAFWYLKTLLVSMKLVDYSTFIKNKKNKIRTVDAVVMVSAVWYLKTLLVSVKPVDCSTFIKKNKRNSGCRASISVVFFN